MNILAKDNQLLIIPQSPKEYRAAAEVVRYLTGLEHIVQNRAPGWRCPAYPGNIAALKKAGYPVPDTAQVIPKPKTRIRLSTGIMITHPAPELLKQMVKLSTFTNPAYTDAKRYGRSLKNINPKIEYFTRTKNSITIPRGTFHEVLNTKDLQEAPVLDRRCSMPMSKPIAFKAELRDRQKEAVDAVLSDDTGFGYIVMPTGAGKTVVACSLIYQLQQKALIVVHTNELLEQWQERLKTFLNVTAGTVGAGKTNIKEVTVGMVQTLRNRPDEIRKRFGLVIIDECHRTPASTFFDLLTITNPQYLYGLTATDYRSDGLSNIIPLALGKCLFEATSKELREDGHVLKPEIINIETDFHFRPNIYGKNKWKSKYAQILTALVADEGRNKLIAEQIDKYANRVSCVLSDRIEHLETLMALCKTKNKAILTGRLGKEERKRIIEQLSKGKIQIVFATSQLLGEGFDAAVLEHLHLPFPMKFKGRIIQVIGRILRPAKGKQPKVINYIDTKQPSLVRQAQERTRAFKQITD